MVEETTMRDLYLTLLDHTTQFHLTGPLHRRLVSVFFKAALTGSDPFTGVRAGVLAIATHSTPEVRQRLQKALHRYMVEEEPEDLDLGALWTEAIRLI